MQSQRGLHHEAQASTGAQSTFIRAALRAPLGCHRSARTRRTCGARAFAGGASLTAKERLHAALASADDAVFRVLNNRRDMAIVMRADGVLAVITRDEAWQLAQQYDLRGPLAALEHELPSMHAWCVVGCADGTRELFVCDLVRGLLLDGIDAMPIARAA